MPARRVWLPSERPSQPRACFLQVSLVEELLSPVLTPLFLLCWFRPRALEIIDFFRHFTVDVAGVGDICSFALMDVKRHGHPQVGACPRRCGAGRLGRRWLASLEAELGSTPSFTAWHL